MPSSDAVAAARGGWMCAGRNRRRRRRISDLSRSMTWSRTSQESKVAIESPEGVFGYAMGRFNGSKPFI
jgi:hypothetical protein